MLVLGLFDFIKDITKENKEIYENQPPVSQTNSSLYIEENVSDENMLHTLEVVENIVEMDTWLFQQDGLDEENKFFYQNPSLQNSIEIARKIQEIRSYLEDDETYAGVDLNTDVLKTSIADFLRNIELFEFEAGDGPLKELYEKVLYTPSDVLKYIIEERKKKLESYSLDPSLLVNKEYAIRIFEYDLLIQMAGSSTFQMERRFVESCARAFADAIIKNLQEKYMPKETLEEEQLEEENMEEENPYR